MKICKRKLKAKPLKNNLGTEESLDDVKGNVCAVKFISLQSSLKASMVSPKKDFVLSENVPTAEILENETTIAYLAQTRHQSLKLDFFF